MNRGVSGGWKELVCDREGVNNPIETVFQVIKTRRVVHTLENCCFENNSVGANAETLISIKLAWVLLSARLKMQK